MGHDMEFVHENTVPSEHQVSEHIVKSSNTEGPRTLFIGNSITLHDVKKEIGWYGFWGMAASCREKDYVHQVLNMVREIVPRASCMTVQAADWERAYWKAPTEFEFLNTAAEYDADIIVVRLGENVQPKELEMHDLTEAFSRLFDFFDPKQNKKLIVTNEFWADARKDRCIEEACRRRGVDMIDISHLGARDDMKAIGLFEHSGVAAHPGDKGMRCIAEVIFEKMKPMLEKERNI